MKPLQQEKLAIPKIYSIRELNTEIRQALGDVFPTALWVHGEVSGFRENSSGHVYFDLVEKDPEKHSVVAKISCFLPAGLARFVIAKFQAAGLPGIQDDIEIQVAGEVSYYSPYGKLSLNIRDIEPAFTLGKMALARQQIIAELEKKGLLEKNRRLELATVPLNIGLITSEGSAAYHDFLKTLTSSGFGFSVKFVTATMQGENTERAIILALKTLARSTGLDLIAIVRGGGSKADLAWFDNQAIAEAIANSPTPILTGIGHEIDLSIADLCAHTTLKTPTAVAEFLCGRVKDFLLEIEEKSNRLVQSTQSMLTEGKTRVETIQKLLPQMVQSRLQRDSHSIQSIISQLTWSKLSRIFILAKEQISRRAERSQALDPMQILRRGFTLTRGADGRFLRSVRQLKPGSMIRTHMSDGEAESEVQKVLKGKGLI